MNSEMHPKGVIPFKVHGRSPLFKACADALSLPDTILSNKTFARRVINHYVSLILQIASFYGAYNPLLPYSPQQSLVHKFIIEKSIEIFLTPFFERIFKILRPHLYLVLQQQSLSIFNSRINRLTYHHSQPSNINKESPPTFRLQTETFLSSPKNPCIIKNSFSTCREATSTPPPPPLQTHAPPPLPSILTPTICTVCNYDCNRNCFICSFFSYHHPNPHCLWGKSLHHRPTHNQKKEYNPPPIQFQFCLEDMEKIQGEDPKITKKFYPEEASQPSYRQESDTSSFDSLSSVVSHPFQKKKKKPTYEDYFNKFGPEHAEIWKTYSEWKKKLGPEVTGTIRPLHSQEIEYFNFHRSYYEKLPVIRQKTHCFTDPPLSWKKRYSSCPIPLNFQYVMDFIIEFSKKHCPNSERNNWGKVLHKIPLGSLQRLLWGIAFLKSTNGVADTVSCGHFRKLIEQSPDISLELCEHPLQVASMIRQTSKWVKNTFVIINIFRYIKENWYGIPCDDFHRWINFYEIGPKTASLLLHAVWDKSSTLPVDSHVWDAFRLWEWTNATTADECSWQASCWMPDEYFIKTNDAIGSIRQSLANKSSQHILLKKCNYLPEDIRWYIKQLAKEVESKKKQTNDS
jgi:endonuclease III